MTSDVALQFADSMLRRFDVDWTAAGFTDTERAELAEHLGGHRRPARSRRMT